MKKTGRENIGNYQQKVIKHRNILVKGTLYHKEFLFNGYSTALNKVTSEIILFYIQIPCVQTATAYLY